MHTSKRSREHSGSLSPLLRSSNGVRSGSIVFSSSSPPSPATFVGLIQYRSNIRPDMDARQRLFFVVRHNLVHMQALQEVLRRTSLAEMRDREVVEWLQGTERWLREFHQPLSVPDVTSGSNNERSNGDALSFFLSGDSLGRAYSSALSELRLLVIGVLHTMPWWRVVETVSKPYGGFMGNNNDGVKGVRVSSSQGGLYQHSASHNSGGGGQRSSRGALDGAGNAAADRAFAARHAITRWHVRLQVAFERVCLVLIEKSQHTVRGVLEVLLKPCHLRPPVRDGARRSITTDSFIRVLNAVATLYSSSYVIELLESCIADFMPRRRWAEHRHHVACTAVLLYVALEGHTPAYHPRLGNSQSLQRAIELLKSLQPCRGDGLESSPWRLPDATHSSSSLALGAGTSEDSGTDISCGGFSYSMPGQHGHRHRPPLPSVASQSFSSILPSASGVLPAGYVSATIFDDAHNGSLCLRQPALLRPVTTTTTATATTTTSDTEFSDSTIKGSACSESETGLIANVGGRGSDNSSTTTSSRYTRVKHKRDGGCLQNAPDALRTAADEENVSNMNTTGAATSTSSLLDVSVEHNNKLLAYRNIIIRMLLNRLIDIEQTLEPCEEESQVAQMGVAAYSSLRGGGGGGYGQVASPFGSISPSGSASLSSLLPASTAVAAASAAQNMGANHRIDGGGNPNSIFFPSKPVDAASVNETATPSSSTRSSPAALSPAGGTSAHSGVCMHFGAGENQPLERFFNNISLPYLRILRDCTTLVYGRLADDLRRQQVAGSCGNADWWEEVLYFYLNVVTRAEWPVYVVYLAPSLAMLGTEDESVNLLHKLITLVTKGSMPVEQPRTGLSCAGVGAGGSSSGSIGGSAFGRLSSMQFVQPVRMRMAPPTGGSRRMVTLEERLRAARHIFPLFRFLRSRVDDTSGEGVRRRLLKWTAQELRRLGDGAGAGVSASSGNINSSNSFVGNVYVRSRQPLSRESRLVLVTFAQCAAISELMEVDILPSAPSHGKSGGEASLSNDEGGRFTTTTVSGDTSDSIAVALQPLLARYTLQTEQPDEESIDENTEGQEEDNINNGMRVKSSESSVSSTSTTSPRKDEEAAPRRRLDLRQMEFEGLLQPQLMANCPWQAWLR